MQTLTKKRKIKVSRASVLSAYHKADENSRATLHSIFGEEVFSQKITDLVKTFDDALEITGKTWNPPAGLPDHVIYYWQLTIIAEALNGDWEADWSDSSQQKHYPWFYNYTAGVGFVATRYAYGSSGTCLGSRLCFKSEELARYAAEQFRDIYHGFLLKTPINNGKEN